MRLYHAKNYETFSRQQLLLLVLYISLLLLLLLLFFCLFTLVLLSALFLPRALRHFHSAAQKTQQQQQQNKIANGSQWLDIKYLIVPFATSSFWGFSSALSKRNELLLCSYCLWREG